MIRTEAIATNCAPGEQRAIAALRAVLPSAAASTIYLTTSGQLDLRVNGIRVDIEWIGDGRLVDARRFITNSRQRSNTVAVARSLSPGARTALTDADIGWIDETGAAEIAIDSLVIVRDGKPQPRADRPLRWTPSVLAAAEALLCGVTATVAATQAATGLSTGSSFNALRTLTDLGLLVASSDRGPTSGRRIGDRYDFLSAYATAASEQSKLVELTVGVIWRDAVEGLSEIGARWSSYGLAWAATGAVASAVLAPMLTSVESALVYVDTTSIVGLEAAARYADLRSAEGGRLKLRPFPTVSTQGLRMTRHGLTVAPWPRVYADLLSTGVRGEEAAEHLREVVDGR